MHELERIINKYLSNGEPADILSDINQEEITKLFQNMNPYEKPDIISTYDNKIVAIEHFEFDSYKNTRAGSDFRIQNGLFINKLIEYVKNKNEFWNHDKIANTSTLEQYYCNFKKVLLSHIGNIPTYKKHIIDDFGNEKEIEIWFFAEDVAPLGSYAYKADDKYLRLLLPFSKENLDVLRQHKEIKGIIFGIYAIKNYKLVLMLNDDKTLDALEKDEYYKVAENDYIRFNPQMTVYAKRISKEILGSQTVNE